MHACMCMCAHEYSNTNEFVFFLLNSSKGENHIKTFHPRVRISLCLCLSTFTKKDVSLSPALHAKGLIVRYLLLGVMVRAIEVGDMLGVPCSGAYGMI